LNVGKKTLILASALEIYMQIKIPAAEIGKSDFF
jgi:hypothetical protein